MAMSRPSFDALMPVKGSLRLVSARWLISILAALPGMAAAGPAIPATRLPTQPKTRVNGMSKVLRTSNSGATRGAMVSACC